MDEIKKILVIEDEPHISKLVRVIMEKNGFEVVQAFSGLDGIEAAKNEKPDLIILDVMMPKMDGFEVSKRLSGIKDIQKTPIIMLSSAAQFKDRARGLESGATDYITKPFDKDQLVEKVKKHLNQN